MYTQMSQYHVVLEVPPKYQYDPEALGQLYVSSSTGQQVPLRSLITSAVKVSPLVVNHQGQFPSVTISYNLLPGTSPGKRSLPFSKSRSNWANLCRCRPAFRETGRPICNRCRARRC